MDSMREVETKCVRACSRDRAQWWQTSFTQRLWHDCSNTRCDANHNIFQLKCQHTNVSLIYKWLHGHEDLDVVTKPLKMV